MNKVKITYLFITSVFVASIITGFIFTMKKDVDHDLLRTIAHQVQPTAGKLLAVATLSNSTAISNAAPDKNEVIVFPANKILRDENAWMQVASKHINREMKEWFGDENTTPQQVKKVLGQVIEGQSSADGSYEHDTLPNDVNVDVMSVADHLELINYLIIGPKSTLKTTSGIGIGSSIQDVIDAYGDEINYGQSTSNYMMIGNQYNCFIFQLKDQKVYSIYLQMNSMTPDVPEISELLK